MLSDGDGRSKVTVVEGECVVGGASRSGGCGMGDSVEVLLVSCWACGRSCRGNECESRAGLGGRRGLSAAVEVCGCEGDLGAGLEGRGGGVLVGGREGECGGVLVGGWDARGEGGCTLVGG